MLLSICRLLHTHRMLMTPFHMLVSARAHTARADSWGQLPRPPPSPDQRHAICQQPDSGYEAWDRGRGAVLDPALPRPGASPPRYQICQASRSCAAVTSPNPVLRIPTTGAFASLGDVTLTELGTTVGMSKAAQSPCGLIAATLLWPWPLERGEINLAAQASPWAHCELFHHPGVGTFS